MKRDAHGGRVEVSSSAEERLFGTTPPRRRTRSARAASSGAGVGDWRVPEHDDVEARPRVRYRLPAGAGVGAGRRAGVGVRIPGVGSR